MQNCLELNWISEMWVGKETWKNHEENFNKYDFTPRCRSSFWLKAWRSHPLLGGHSWWWELLFSLEFAQSLLRARQHQVCSYSDLMTRIFAFSSSELQFSGIHKPWVAFPCFWLLFFFFPTGLGFCSPWEHWCGCAQISILENHLFQDHLQISFCLASVRILLFFDNLCQFWEFVLWILVVQHIPEEHLSMGQASRVTSHPGTPTASLPPVVL